jgi:hypothetical protein
MGSKAMNINLLPQQEKIANDEYKAGHETVRLCPAPLPSPKSGFHRSYAE